MTNRRRIGTVLRVPLAALVLAVAALPADATTLRRMDLSELVTRAERIVHARAVDKNVHWDASGTQIYTDTTFEVIDEAKGKGPRRFTVSLLGGVMGGVEMREEGTPLFKQGEEVVLFTSPLPSGKKALVGFSQGAMRIADDPATGHRMVVADVPAGVTFMEQTVQGLRPVRPVSQRARLDQFMEKVRKAASGEIEIRPLVSPRIRHPKAVTAVTPEEKP
ncbi:MAG: hypothetical protein ACREAA_10695 [Candidatus Polarisedimenticolia bacterium]